MEEKLDFLNEFLIKDLGKEINEKPITLEEKEKLWRGLCNIREAKPISDEYLKVQDAFLKERLKNRTIACSDDIQTVRKNYPNCILNNCDRMALWRGDITDLKIDCIVNAANSRGLGCFQPLHNCIDNMVQTYSGVQMRLECNDYMKVANFDYGLPTGDVFITNGYNLPAKYVIHTIGPVINFNVSDEEKELLKKCYKNSLRLAVEKGLKEIAFPCISTGIFRFPRRIAVDCAVSAVDEFLDNNNQIEKVIFDVFGEENFEIYDDYFSRIKSRGGRLR